MKFVDEALIRVEAGDVVMGSSVSAAKNLYPKVDQMVVMAETAATFI